MEDVRPKALMAVAVPLPPPGQRVRRGARFAAPGERKDRYSLPEGLDTSSPVGYRTRLSLDQEQAEKALALLSLERPTGFGPAQPISEAELFEECALGVLASRQSTNCRGQRQVTLGPEDSPWLADRLRRLGHGEAPVLDGAAYTHVVLSRRYKTPFTMLLTLVGHKPILNLFTVPWRILKKRLWHQSDIPSIACLQYLHLGILADGMERAAVIASAGTRRAQVLLGPFVGEGRVENQAVIRDIGTRCGLSRRDLRQGWRISLVAQVGQALPTEVVSLPGDLARRLGATLLALRSERVQPGVNQEERAPAPYQARQDMSVPDDLVIMAGRAAYNAFSHWTGTDREAAKELLRLRRVDVLTPGGKESLRAIRKQLGDVTDRLIRDLPLWADLPTGKAFSRNANKGRKAFSLAGQRIYIAGLDPALIAGAGVDWERAVCAVGAAAARSALYAELMGCLGIPDDCDLLLGACMMAGPVNQNDVGKQFYGVADLLTETFGGDPMSLLVWTLKAKTVADPVGNEEQLMSKARKGGLVDLRPGPHEVVGIRKGGVISPMRRRDGRQSAERAFGDQGNFVTDPDGQPISGNAGESWPEDWRREPVW